jgi:ABC-2 type transport system permease protein
MNTVRIYLLETKYEFLKLLRIPGFWLPTLIFPVVFYLFFGVGFGQQRVGNVRMAAYLIATYGAFGVIGASLLGLGVLVALERGQGWLQVKRTTPMPVAAYFVSKVAMAVLFSSVIVLTLFALGMQFGGIHLTLGKAAALFSILISGSLTFCSLGLAIGYFMGPNSAGPMMQLFYLPMSFLSGLWIPIWILPKPLQTIAFFLPPYHYSQLALGVIGAGRGGSTLTHVLFLVISTAIFMAIAYAGWRRDEGKTYG